MSFRHVAVIAIVLTGILACSHSDEHAEGSGRVTTTSGQPIAGGTVTVWTAAVPRSVVGGELRGQRRVVTGRTSTDGSFRVRVPRTGFVVEARADGFAPLWIESGPYVGQILDLGSLHLVRTATVAGRVVDDRGAPLAGARVVVASPQTGIGVTATQAITVGDGRFEVRDAPSGRVVVTVSAPGFAVLVTDLEAARPLALRLARGRTVEGRVRDVGGRPAGHAWVAVDGVSARAASDGAFRIDGVATGELFIRAAAGDAVGSAFATADHGELAITVRAAASLTGTVRDESTRRPLAGVAVEVQRRHRSGGMVVTELDQELAPPLAFTDEQGRFRLPLLRSGKATVVLSHRGHAVRAIDVELRSGKARRVNAALSPLARLRGRVHDATGGPVAFARISTATDAWTTTTADGAFDLPYASTESDVAITARVDDGRIGSGRCASTMPCVITVAMGGRLTGQVRMDDRGSLANAHIEVERFDETALPVRAATTSDEHGRFAFAGLEDGTYSVLVRHDDAATTTVAPVVVRAPEVSLGELRLVPAMAVHGTVVGDGVPLAGVEVWGSGRAASVRAVTDARGRFSLSGFTAGEHVQVVAVRVGDGATELGVTAPVAGVVLELRDQPHAAASAIPPGP